MLTVKVTLEAAELIRTSKTSMLVLAIASSEILEAAIQEFGLLSLDEIAKATADETEQAVRVVLALFSDELDARVPSRHPRAL